MAVIESTTKTICRILGNPRHFQILSFHVEGLKTKLHDPSFLELIQKYVIIISTETWKANTLKINIEGFGIIRSFVRNIKMLLYILGA